MTATVNRDAELARIIDRHMPGGHGEIIVREARRAGLLVSVACAVVEQESGGMNVFGHDPVRRPQVKGGKVTRGRYARYRALRRVCGNQGVGLMQLTSPGYQDMADKLGGCWKPTYQLRVGFMIVRGLIAQHGRRRGLASYNAGEAGWRNGETYAAQVEQRIHRWHERLT